MTYYQLLSALDEAKRWSDKYDELKEIKNGQGFSTQERAQAESKMRDLRILLSQEIEP